MPVPTTVQQGVKMRFYHSTLCPRRKCFVVRPHACRPPLRSAILSTCRFMNMPVRFAAMLSSTWPERSPINLRPVPPAVQRNWPSSSRRSRRQRRCPKKHAAIAPARLPVRLHAREAAPGPAALAECVIQTRCGSRRPVRHMRAGACRLLATTRLHAPPRAGPPASPRL